MRGLGAGLGHRVPAPATPGAAAAEPAQGEQRAAGGAVGHDRLEGVGEQVGSKRHGDGRPRAGDLVAADGAGQGPGREGRRAHGRVTDGSSPARAARRSPAQIGGGALGGAEAGP